jgi:hypothetical protein
VFEDFLPEDRVKHEVSAEERERSAKAKQQSVAEPLKKEMLH